MCVCVCCNAHRKALKAKAALYNRLCGGEGLRRGGSDDSEGEEEEEGRYMVDFTRKIAEEVKSTYIIICIISQRGDSPFVYRDGTGLPASLPYIRKIHVSVAISTQSGIRLHERVPMVKI